MISIYKKYLFFGGFWILFLLSRILYPISFGTIILLYGLFILGRAVYKVADYYKEIKFNKTVEGEVVGYLRSSFFY